MINLTEARRQSGDASLLEWVRLTMSPDWYRCLHLREFAEHISAVPCPWYKMESNGIRAYAHIANVGIDVTQSDVRTTRQLVLHDASCCLETFWGMGEDRLQTKVPPMRRQDFAHLGAIFFVTLAYHQPSQQAVLVNIEWSQTPRIPRKNRQEPVNALVPALSFVPHVSHA
jgi:hypothetical protein